MAEAADVRHWAEEQAFHGVDDCLSGWCAKASAELNRRLKKVGITSEIHLWIDPEGSGSAHVYVVVDDHVVDVTASQFKKFRKHRLIIMHTREAAAHQQWQGQEVFQDAASLRKSQRKSGWPADQVALPA